MIFALTPAHLPFLFGFFSQRGKRLASLDATRGLTVCVMIFVDTTGGVLKGRVNHSPW